MVVLAAIIIASPVLAAGTSNAIEVAKQGPKKLPTVISMTATIFAVDKANKKVYVRIQMTNRAFIQYRGDYEWVQTNSTTKYYSWDGTTRSPYSFDRLVVGDRVSINATVNPTTKAFTARRVQVNQPRIPR